MTIISRRRALFCSALALCAFLALACASKSTSGAVEVSLTPAGCDPAQLTLPAGKTTFHVTNKGASAITEFEILDGNHIVGEIENVASGLDRTFTTTLTPGTFTMYCPGGTINEKGTLTVTGAAEPTATAAGPETTIDVTESDYTIEAQPAEAPAGRFTFDITNDGPTTHEFVVIKTDLPADQLPVADSEVNEDDSRLQHIDEVEDIKAGDETSFTVDLAPGHYVFICNITGHYEMGMHTDFTVK